MRRRPRHNRNRSFAKTAVDRRAQRAVPEDQIRHRGEAKAREINVIFADLSPVTYGPGQVRPRSLQSFDLRTDLTHGPDPSVA